MRRLIFFAVLAAVLILPAVILLLLSGSTTLTVEPPIKVVGADTPVRVTASNPHGMRRFTAAIEQDGVRHVVHQSSEPASRFLFWRRRDPTREIRFNASAKKAGVKNGKARLIVEAVSNDLRARTDRAAFDIEINTRPPAVSADGLQHYINQGGAELVLFTASGYWTEAGVRVGKYTFRSFPLPGKAPGEGGVSERFSLFGYPWVVSPDTVPVVYARNPTGAEATATFWHKVFPKPFRSRRLEIDDRFLNKVVPSIDHGASGELLERFLKINGPLRRENNQALSDLRLKTEEKILWAGPFVQLTNSKVESQFADARTYIYQGKEVDKQVHLGFDLSVTRNTPVTAANSGIVRHGADLGIYGNTVVIDHGYGLQTIYAHLSRIDVKPGDQVKKGQPIGLSGDTGLAGGDHLHFSMQIDGVQVNPVEWWDDHWIQDRIRSKLPVPAQ
jgi:hypothetical protein